MCVLYLNFQARKNEQGWKNDISKDALEVLLRRHWIERVSDYMLIGDFWTVNIVSDNLNRRDICCFGQGFASYMGSGFHLKTLPYNPYQSERAQQERVWRERNKRWNILDAGEWISFFHDVVSALHRIGGSVFPGVKRCDFHVGFSASKRD